ncbi:MAG: hypothetical protein OXE83_13675 [Gammaproteobacteria bacterium]|nr:hypothetical protein [Gammaproteobacteria bacterium]
MPNTAKADIRQSGRLILGLTTGSLTRSNWPRTSPSSPGALSVLRNRILTWLVTPSHENAPQHNDFEGKVCKKQFRNPPESRENRGGPASVGNC